MLMAKTSFKLKDLKKISTFLEKTLAFFFNICYDNKAFEIRWTCTLKVQWGLMPLIIYYDIKSSVLLHSILVGRNNIRNGGVSLDLQLNDSICLERLEII